MLQISNSVRSSCLTICLIALYVNLADRTRHEIIIRAPKIKDGNNKNGIFCVGREQNKKKNQQNLKDCENINLGWTAWACWLTWWAPKIAQTATNTLKTVKWLEFVFYLILLFKKSIHLHVIWTFGRMQTNTSIRIQFEW